jgi:hypothetical protein
VINEILTASGLPCQETQFLRPPAKTYAVYMDDVETDGGDYANLIYRHDVTVELYEPKPDPEAEAAVERELNVRGIKWHKQPRYWVELAQRYQVIYEFAYIQKL